MGQGIQVVESWEFQGILEYLGFSILNLGWFLHELNTHQSSQKIDLCWSPFELYIDLTS